MTAGLVVLAYVTSHFLNHSLGVISVAALDRAGENFQPVDDIAYRCQRDATRFAEAGVVELDLGLGIALERAKVLFERMLDTAWKSLKPLGHGH